MRHRKIRRFRYRPGGRSRPSHNGDDQSRLGHSSFSNGRIRNNFKPQLSAEKLVERYNTLAKEALTSGDRILSENYYQHADHYMRSIVVKNINQNQNKFKTHEGTISEKSAATEETLQNKNNEEKNRC